MTTQTDQDIGETGRPSALSPQPLIEVEKLEAWYGRRRILHGTAHDHANLARVHTEVDSMQNAPPAVPGFELFDFYQGLGAEG